jgi:hypothetical protein
MLMRICYLDCHEAGLCCYLVIYIVTGRCHSTDADLVSAVTNADIVTATTDMHGEWVEAFQR